MTTNSPAASSSETRSVVLEKEFPHAPQKVWRALTDAGTTEKYWFGFRLSSDWTVGSPIALDGASCETFNEGVILESDPPRRLSYTWHPQDERPSRVTFQLDELEGQVRLTVVHDDFDVGSKVFERISGGWPNVLSSLKSFIETGSGLPTTWRTGNKPGASIAEART